MNDTEFILQEPRDDRAETARKAVDAAFTSLSLLADSLVYEAEAQTKTREEYIAFMKGAAFLFYRVCKRDDGQYAKKPNGINTVQDAINHCWALYPFMSDVEREEHLKLVGWLNQLLILTGQQAINAPQEYLDDKDLRVAIAAYKNSRTH